MKQDSKKIGFSIQGIQTEQFALFEENYNSKASVGLGTQVQYKIDPVHKQMGVFMTFQFMQQKNIFIKVVVSCHFQIDNTSWNEFVFPEHRQLIVPQLFMSQLAAITMGTARGILFSKTENTTFAKFVIPDLNAAEMITKDACFELEVD
jgi:hypothetical protein